MQSHEIGLWTINGGTPLVSTTITDANSTTVNSFSGLGNWRSTPITSLQLTPGDYVVGAFYLANSPDAFIAFATTSTIPEATFKEARNGVGSGLVFPSTSAGEVGGGFFGPNLFTAAAPPVPEPEAYAMLMAGLVLLAFIARRRGKSLNAAA